MKVRSNEEIINAIKKGIIEANAALITNYDTDEASQDNSAEKSS